MKTLELPSVHEIRQVLDYDTETGVFLFKDGSPAGHLCPKGYRIIRIYGRNYRAGRLAFKLAIGHDPEHEVDHINGNRSDDKAWNLRDATRSENNRNHRLRRDNASGFKGVSMEKRTGRYRALITAGGKQQSLGYFETAEQAHKAYATAAFEMHKGFACLG